MFEKALRMKLRFYTDRGVLSVEDLYDLSLQDLNKIAKSLNKELKEADEEDFLEEKSESDVKIELAFNLVIYVLNEKKAEMEIRKNAKAIKEQKDKILNIIAEKQDEATRSMSIEDLQKELDKLG